MPSQREKIRGCGNQQCVEIFLMILSLGINSSFPGRIWQKHPPMKLRNRNALAPKSLSRTATDALLRCCCCCCLPRCLCRLSIQSPLAVGPSDLCGTNRVQHPPFVCDCECEPFPPFSLLLTSSKS